MHISKVNVKDNVVTINYTESVVNHASGGVVESTYTKKCNALPHNDLLLAMANFQFHLANFTLGMVIDGIEANVETLSKFRIHTIQMRQRQDFVGVIISGYCEAIPERFSYVETPQINMGSAEETYKYDYILSDAVDVLLGELDLYLTGQKLGEPQQLELAFE